MATNINPNNINGQYPIAGQDNDSQGFRDNFTNIKNNFSYAAEEVVDLQNKVVLKAPLIGSSSNTVLNDVTNVTFRGALIVGETEVAYPPLVSAGAVTLSYANGSFQYIEELAEVVVTVTFATPTSQYAKMRLFIKNTGAVTNYISFAAASGVTYYGLEKLTGWDPVAHRIAPTLNDYRMYEISTYDNGANIIVIEII
jgi:endoglucanase Acf2